MLCPDLRGFGFSDAPGQGYDPETFAADAAALLDALEIERTFLVGHDWGGYTGFLLCFEQPQRIEAFVALNTPVPWLRALAAAAGRGLAQLVRRAHGGRRRAAAAAAARPDGARNAA